MNRPILIAECCQNHNGRRDLLRSMIYQAAESGADYVKIQAIRSRELANRARFEEGLTGPDGQPRAIKRPFGPERERLSKLDLSLGDEAWFVDECRRVGVRSMTTVFTRTAAREVKDFGYDAVKIASYDCRSYPLLRDAAKWWSTMIVSTGASYDQEIERAADELKGVELTLLHCVTIYPTPMHELHLRRMGWLKRFTPRVGLSDHTAPGRDGPWASRIALGLGASCIERHFTVLPPDQTKDGPVSIDPAGLADLRRFSERPRTEQMEIIKREYPDWEKTLGVAQRPLSPTELLNRDYYSGRFASRIGDRFFDNWEDVDIDRLLSEEGGAR
jgi:N,N'-diacetyllegionaminate synthase